jgi:hypothetical protein
MRAMVTRGLLIVLVCLGGAGPAHAAGWTPLMPLGFGDDGSVVADLTSAGAATLVWRGTYEGDPAILATARAPGGSFTAPVPLSRDAVAVGFPKLAVSRNGVAVVAWAEKTSGGNWTLQVAMRSGGVWSPPEQLSEPPAGGSAASDSDVAINDNDEALVIWTTAEAVRQSRVHVSTRPPGGAWGTSDIRNFAESAVPHVVVDHQGNATVTYLNAVSATPNLIIEHRPAGGVWSEAVELGPAKYPDLAVGADGTVAAAWQDNNAEPQAAIRPPGGPWSDPEPLGFWAGTYKEEPLGIALDGSGTATAVGGASHVDVETNRRPAGGAWAMQTEKLIPTPGFTYHYYPSIVANARGFTLISWLGVKDPDPLSGYPFFFAAAYTNVAMRQPGGAWTPGMNVGEPGGLVSADVDGGSNALVSWATYQTHVIYARVYDSTGPQVDVSIPAGIVAGVRAPLAATIRDDWSAPGQTTWDFGDGAQAAGDSPGHTYAAPGRYTVRVTGEDTRGNATTVERVVDVAPEPPSLELDAARFFRAGFDRSQLSKRARVLVEGAINAPVAVSARLEGPLRPTADRRSFSLGVRQLAPGGFSERFSIPKAVRARMLPGEYVLRLTGPGLAPVTQALELRAPPEGVVMARRISTSRNGPNLLRVTTAKKLWATFSFAPDGAARKRLRARWYAPGSGKPVGSFPVKRAFSYWQNPRGLAKGRWRCVLVGQDGVVASVSIRVG